MILSFFKYEGTGNDFIMIDDRSSILKNSANTISRLCNRKFGIGADGLILLNKHPEYDFRMSYFNANGQEANICGNGGRCITAFARDLGLITEKAAFLANDGKHSGFIIKRAQNKTIVRLSLNDVDHFRKNNDHLIINTGVPHYIKFVDQIDQINVFEEGRKIRYSKPFSKDGINVDFVQIKKNHLFVRTYERGVENETLSCGTGVTASALAAYLQIKSEHFIIKTPGGELIVDFQFSNGVFKNIWLTGPVQKVFNGEINI